MTSKIQVDFRFNTYLEVLVNVSYRFLNFFHYSCFWGQGIHCWHFYRATLFGWPRKSRSTSVRFKGDSKILIIVSYGFSQFLHCLCYQGQGIHCWHSYWATMFEWPRKSKLTSVSTGQGIHCWYLYRATMFGWPRKSRWTSGSTGTRRYWWLRLVDFWNFFTIYFSEVRESFADIPTELSCFGDLENSGQLPVQEVFEVTQTFVRWLKKCSKFISSRAKVAGRSHDQRFIANWLFPHAINLS